MSIAVLDIARSIPRATYRVSILRMTLTPQMARDRLRAMSRVKDQREKKKLTQQELAGKAGISIRGLQSVESGQSNPTLRTMQRIADALGVSVADLLEEGAA